MAENFDGYGIDRGVGTSEPGAAGLALVGVTVVVIDMVDGREAAVGSSGVALRGFSAVWLALPQCEGQPHVQAW